MNTRLEATIKNLEEYVAPFTKKYVRPAFKGDVDAALSLLVSLNNDLRGAVAVIMWNSKVSKPAFRAFLAAVWEHDHGWLIGAAETRRRLGAMFRYADFPKPAGLPEVVKVWRGTSSQSYSEAVSGYSWTTNRDIACWFAMRLGGADHGPLVLSAEVKRNDVALFHNGRNEHEAVIIKYVSAATIDGNAAEWLEAMERWEGEKNARLAL